MKAICTIANNNGTEDRVTILWNEEDNHLYGQTSDGIEMAEETAETIEEACEMAQQLWGNGWDMENIDE